MKKQPLIILGMHRSGTSLVARCLDDIGLYTGSSKDDNFESVFFLDLNNWMMRSCHASWDNPRSFKFMSSVVEKELLRVIELQMRSFFRRRRYLGTRKALKYKDLRDLDFPWGWKDPRNTFTIDLWQKIFPECRMLHVYRHPVDVAASLSLREEKEKEKTRAGRRRTLINRLKEYFVRGTVLYQTSVRADHVFESITIWEDYVNRALVLDESRMMHIRYEDFVLKPVEHLERIAEFAGLDFDERTAKAAAERIDKSRRFPFMKDEELKEVYEEIRHRPLMKRLGYSGPGK